MASTPFLLVPTRPKNEVIDMSEKKGVNHYKNATKKLEEDLYDCDPDGFYQFMKSLKERADEFEWSDGILMVAPDPSKPNIKKNLITDYGVIGYEAVKEHELKYVDSDSRQAQDTRMLYGCIMNSLSASGKAKLNINDEQYIIGKKGRRAGVCLLKVLVRESYLDSNATSTMIRTKLSNLDEYIVETKNDIAKFNSHVRVLTDMLKSRGETTHDLLANLFKAYAACTDQVFVKYISDVQTRWEEGEELTSIQLMDKALQKYNILLSKEKWEAPSLHDEKLIALEARFSEMKRKWTNGKQANKKGKDGKKSKKLRKERKKPEWVNQRPSDADLKKPREWNNVKWHWCSTETGGKCHGVYRVHHPSKCKTEPKVSGPKKGKGDDDKDVEVTVAQTTIDDPFSEMQIEDEDELMGGYETG